VPDLAQAFTTGRINALILISLFPQIVSGLPSLMFQ
jgi:hypothetical protein